MIRSRTTQLFAALALAAATIGAGPARADFPTADEMLRRVQRVAPPNPLLPGKILCACPQTGMLSRAVGWVTSFVSDHGSYTTVDVWCAYEGFFADGRPAFVNACGDFEVLK